MTKIELSKQLQRLTLQIKKAGLRKYEVCLFLQKKGLIDCELDTFYRFTTGRLPMPKTVSGKPLLELIQYACEHLPRSKFLRELRQARVKKVK